MNLFLSIAPIVFLIYIMTKKNGVPSYIALQVTALIIFLIQLFYWNNPINSIFASLVTGLGDTLTPITIIFGAILFNRMMEVSGAITIIKQWLSTITPNPIAQVVIIGWAFAFMIEGASGFGTPAAIAAPLLVSIGFRALPISMCVLVMNSVPVSFGAVGTPTWFGFGALNLRVEEILEIGIKSSIIHFFAALIIPLLALKLITSWSEIRKNIIFIYISIFSCTIPYVAISQFNYEFPSLVGGGIGFLISVISAKLNIGISKNINYLDIQFDHKESKYLGDLTIGVIIKALIPFILLIVILIVTRIQQLGIKSVLNSTNIIFKGSIGYLGDFSISDGLIFQLSNIFESSLKTSYKLLYVPSLIPFIVTVVISILLFSVKGKEVKYIFISSLSNILKPFIALIGALIMVKLMLIGNKSGESLSMVATIGNSLSSSLGKYWIYFAPYLGALGAFFSGSNTVSNLTFGGIQQAIAKSAELNTTTILAAQSVGGAMGNMVCINNIIAVCTVTNVKDKEGYIIKKTFVPMFIYGLITVFITIVFMS